MTKLTAANAENVPLSCKTVFKLFKTEAECRLHYNNFFVHLIYCFRFYIPTCTFTFLSILHILHTINRFDSLDLDCKTVRLFSSKSV